MAKFLPNPEANWGPKSRAQPNSNLKRKLGPGTFEQAKSKVNQGKNAAKNLAKKRKKAASSSSPTQSNDDVKTTER